MPNQSQSRRQFCRAMGITMAGAGLSGCTAPRRKRQAETAAPDKPNFIIILTDDQGYSDLGCYGATRIRTPRIDRMAAEGARLTSFYTQTVCGPARAALLTGCYPVRVMRAGDDIGKWRLPTSEITIAEVLKSAGYATACTGKWDLSGRAVREGELPNDQGFDYYFGTLGANDGGRVRLFENKEPLGETDDMGCLTELYTDKALGFLREHKDEPFFLYIPYTMPHVVLGASERFRGKSAAGLYGDVIEEIDWNVGRVVDAVAECGLSEKTYVIFASDNGPWLCMGENGGACRPLRSGKGSAWEGGFRVPSIIRAPGRVPAGTTIDEMAATLDVLPTLAALGGAEVPDDRVIDGVDQSGFITGQGGSARDNFLYYVQDNLHAVRWGRWKLALPERSRFYPYAQDSAPVRAPELYDLATDIGEEHDVADRHPDIVVRLLGMAERAREEIGDADRIGATARSRPD